MTSRQRARYKLKEKKGIKPFTVGKVPDSAQLQALEERAANADSRAVPSQRRICN